MTALLERDPETLAAVRPQRDVVSRALEIQRARDNPQGIRPVSLTYVGGGQAGSTSLAIYVVGVRSADGHEAIFPFKLRLLGGKVVRLE